MAHGKPVVATATEGARELFGQQADLVDIKEPVKLADSISELLDDQTKRNSAGEANRTTAAELFSLKRMVDETEELYRTILR